MLSSSRARLRGRSCRSLWRVLAAAAGVMLALPAQAAPQKTEIRSGGLVADIYREATPSGRRAAVIVLGGSEGGVGAAAARDAELLAEHGYVVMQLAYFGAPGLPEALGLIPLEYFKGAIDVLRAQPDVDPDRIGVEGTSIGGEVALTIAAHFPEIHAVVAAVPSSVVWPGIGAGASASTFTLAGQPLPFVPYGPGAATIYELYAKGLASRDAVPEAAIPVERINGPVILICGRSDSLWPSCPMSEQVAGRLKARGFRPPVQLLAYSDAGHAVFGPPLDRTSPKFPQLGSLGGTAEGNQAARQDDWPRSIAFLDEALAPAKAPGFSRCKDTAGHAELADTQCAVERVPLRQGESGAAIDLFVRLFPAQGRRKGAVWLVSGGPGESGATFYPLIDRLRASFPGYDLIVPDHRGTGYSTRLCPAEEAADSPGGFALAGAEWGSCYASLNKTPDYVRSFTITQAAHDLAELMRRDRRPGKVYVYGVSYGTQLGLRLLDIPHPHIDGMLLDSLVPYGPVAEWDLSHRSQVTDRVGREVLHRCDLEPACRRRMGGSAEQALQALLQRPTAGAQVPGGDLRTFLGGLLDFPSTRARIPELIADLNAERRDSLDAVKADLARLGARFSSYAQSEISIPLVSLISCSENNARPELTREQVKEEASHLLFASPLPGLLVQSGLPLYPRDAHFAEIPRHSEPILVLHGTLDPKTPFEGALDHASRLRAGGPVQLVPAKDAPHFILLNAPHCFEAAARRFVGEAGPSTSVCSRPEQEN